ncbi:MAG: flagellar type III secretion system pore protein FliP [Planctomycetes bacterium]|nr:flagellar type III secretion system pore protein FliP [Planctomycetota bacterium]
MKRMRKPVQLRRAASLALGASLPVLLAASVASAEGIIPTWSGLGRSDDPQQVTTTLQAVLFFTVLSLAPTLLVLTTSFTRFVIVLSFVRRALSTQDLPPTQVLTGLALLLTVVVMAPTFAEIQQQAVVPYANGEITQKSALERGVEPLRKFMFTQVRRKDLKLMLDLSHTTPADPANLRRADVPTTVLVPAFVLSELRRAFVMGFAIFLPFLVIDLVVSSTLISLGMYMLPPAVVSLPFKLLLFILVDGWHLLVGSLVQSFGAV